MPFVSNAKNNNNSSSTSPQQSKPTERLISNRELFASMTLEPYDAKEEERKAQIKPSNAQLKKEYEERERQTINTNHVITCMKRAFHTYFTQGGSDVLRPLDPATDFSMVATTRFDDGRTTHRGEELLGGVFGCLCNTSVRTREQQIAEQQADMESDGNLLSLANRKSYSSLPATTATAKQQQKQQDNFTNNNNNNNKVRSNEGSGATTTKTAALTLSQQQLQKKGVGSGVSSPNTKNSGKTLMIPVDENGDDFPSGSAPKSSATATANASPTSAGLFRESTNQTAFGISNDATNRIAGVNRRKGKSASGGGGGGRRSNGKSNSSVFSCLAACGAGDVDTDDDDDDDSSSRDNSDSSSSDNDSDDSDIDGDDYEEDEEDIINNNNNKRLKRPAGPTSSSTPAAMKNPNQAKSDQEYANSIAFEFTDFAPMCYRHIRHIFGIEPEHFAKVLVNSNWHSIPTPGKSSAQLYFCGENWVIKTMTEGESDFLSRILHRYYYHVRDNPHSLLPHFVGHHRLKFKDVDGSDDVEFTFVIMQNVFATPLKIHTKFDLKGSTVGRFATAEEKKKTTCTRKDLDINRPIRLGETRKSLLMQQLTRDCDFLRRSEIMDYSFLVGIHDMSKGYPVWHNVSANDTTAVQNSNDYKNSHNINENEKGIFGDFNSNVFDAELRQQFELQQQQMNNNNNGDDNNTKSKNSKNNNNNNNNKDAKKKTKGSGGDGNNHNDDAFMVGNNNENASSSASLFQTEKSRTMSVMNNNNTNNGSVSSSLTNFHRNSNNNNNNNIDGSATPPLLTITDPSATFYAPSEKVDPIRGEDPANNSSIINNNNVISTSTAAGTSTASGNNSTTISGPNANSNNAQPLQNPSSMANQNQMNNQRQHQKYQSSATSGGTTTPENASTSSITGIQNQLQSKPQNERTSSASVATTSANTNSNISNNNNYDANLQISQQRRRRAQSGIHNHPHLVQAYQSQQGTNNNNNNNQQQQLQQHHHVDPTNNANPYHDYYFDGNNNNHNQQTSQHQHNRSRRGSAAITLSQPNSPESSHNNHFPNFAPNHNNNNNSSHPQNNNEIMNTHAHNNGSHHAISGLPSPFGLGAVGVNVNNNNNNNSVIDERCFTSDSGGMLSTRREEIYYLGVIDILQEYNWWKRAETVIMGTIHDRDQISSVDPRTYARRFIDFMESIVM